MTVTPLEFSQLGDEHFDRFKARFPAAHQERLLVEQRLDAARMEDIRASVAGYVAACLGLPHAPEDEAELTALLESRRGTIPNHDPGGALVPKAEHFVEFNHVQRSLAAAFEDFRLQGLVDSIDLPVNVRTVFGRADRERMRLPYASAKVHSDVWAGVPYDAVVVVLPVLGDIENITIECAEMPREDEMPWMRPLADYADGEVRAAVPYERVRMRHGHIYFADSRLLHHTVRKQSSGVRVSIDFRFRMHAAGAYRSLLPPSFGPDTPLSTVRYEEWVEIGSEKRIAFEDSVKDPMKSSDGSPISAVRYRIINVPAPRPIQALHAG